MGVIIGRVAQAIVNHLSGDTGTNARRWILRVSGGGAAGKSFLTREICNLLDSCNIVATDSYLVSSTIRKIPTLYGEQRLTACHPDATFLPALERDIKTLRSGDPFWTIPDFGAPSYKVDPNKPTIVEGIAGVFIEDLLFDLSVFILCDRETEWGRRVQRDQAERRVEPLSIRADFDVRRDQFHQHINPRQNNCELVLLSRPDFSLEIIKDASSIV